VTALGELFDGRVLCSHIACIGRNDFTIEVRGDRHRAGRDRVQAAVVSLVREALVMAREDATGARRPTATGVMREAWEGWK
jgi:acyl-coenzyme A synthetase/AMP-(fatty) acid ligase